MLDIPQTAPEVKEALALLKGSPISASYTGTVTQRGFLEQAIRLVTRDIFENDQDADAYLAAKNFDPDMTNQRALMDSRTNRELFAHAHGQKIVRNW